MGFAILIVAVIAAGVFYITIYKVIKGLDTFTRVARSWQSEQPQRVELMRSLGSISAGVSATLWIFAVLFIEVLALVAVSGVVAGVAGI